MPSFYALGVFPSLCLHKGIRCHSLVPANTKEKYFINAELNTL